MQFDTVLLKTTVRDVLKSMDISGAIARVEYGGEFWTHIYFEAKLARAEEIVVTILKELRSHEQFRHRVDRSDGDETHLLRFRNFTNRPSAIKSIDGVAIYESLVPVTSRRSESSGKVFAYMDNTSFIEKSISTANILLERAQNAGAKAYSVVNMFIPGDDGKQTTSPPQPNSNQRNVWVKFDADRCSQWLTVDNSTSFDEFCRLAVLKVEARKATSSYVFLDQNERVMESMEDILSMKGNDVIAVVLRTDAFATRR
jgi:hypothetical protein